MEDFLKWLQDIKKKKSENFENASTEIQIGYLISYLIETDNYIGMHVEMPLTTEKLNISLKNRINGLR